jgi:hypothetical protein
MAYSFGGGVQAQLGATDYSSYLRGSLQGAEGVAAGGAAIGQGIQNFGAGIAKGVKGYYEKKEKDEKNQLAVDTIAPILSTPEARAAAGIPANATQKVVNKYILQQVEAFGAEASLALATQYRNSAAFQKGITGTPSYVSENIESKTADLSKLPTASQENFTPSYLVDTPQQSVESFMDTGRTRFDAPALKMNIAENSPEIQTPSKIATVPDNLKEYFGFNAQTQRLVPTRKLEEDTFRVTKQFQDLEIQKNNINTDLAQGYETQRNTTVGAPDDTTPFRGEKVIKLNQDLAMIENQQAPLQQKLIELNNIRAQGAELGNPNRKETSIENKASQVIDRSIRFSQEINSNPKDKNEWMQMKTVLKTVSRNATDEEKIAGFIKGYSDIAPIDESVYLKMNQLFDKTPVITNLGEGNKLVTVNGKSFILPAGDTKPQSVAALKYDDEESYAGLLLLANEIGLDELKAKHKPTYDQLWKLNKKFGRTSTLTGQIFSLEEVLGVVTPLPTQPGGKTSSRFNVTVN